MKENEMFAGFSKEKQAEYEKQIIERFGEAGRSHIEESKKNVSRWSKEDSEKFKSDFALICQDLVRLMAKKLAPEDTEVQEVIGRHYMWLKKCWTPTRVSYASHGQFIAESDLRKAYEAHHKELPEFIARAIQVFAKSL